MRILVVDDSALIRSTVAMVLRRAGHTLLGEAADGETGLRLAVELAPDLLLTDLRMPRMDGLCMTRHLRRQGFANPVVMMSSHSDPAIRREAIDSGVSRFISKPMNVEDLLSALIDTARPQAA